MVSFYLKISSVAAKPKFNQGNADKRDKLSVLSGTVVPVKFRTFGRRQGWSKVSIMGLG